MQPFFETTNLLFCTRDRYFLFTVHTKVFTGTVFQTKNEFFSSFGGLPKNVISTGDMLNLGDKNVIFQPTSRTSALLTPHWSSSQTASGRVWERVLVYLSVSNPLELSSEFWKCCFLKRLQSLSHPLDIVCALSLIYHGFSDGEGKIDYSLSRFPYPMSYTATGRCSSST